MQISKLSSVICAVAVGASLVSVRAQDNPAQAAARAALLQQMNEAEKTPTQPPAGVVAPSAPMEKPAPPTAVQTPPPAQPEPSVTASPGDNPAQAAARAALLQQMNGSGAVNAQSATPSTSTQMTAAESAAQAKLEAQKQAQIAAQAADDAQKQSEAAVQAKARAEAAKATAMQAASKAQAEEARAQAEAEAQKLAEQKRAAEAAAAQAEAQKAAVLAAEQKRAAEARAQQAMNAQKSAAKTDVIVLPAISAPALPVSTTKEQRLQGLLAKYKADQITPEQYHNQRAAILAEP